MTGFFLRDPASVRGKRFFSADTGSNTPGENPLWRKTSSRGGPRGNVSLANVLVEEQGKYGPVFILRLVKFPGTPRPGSPDNTENAHSVCESILRKYVGDEGSCSLHGGGGGFFVFRFGYIGNAEASRRARAATNEIGHTLLGDRFIQSDLDDLSTANGNGWKTLPGSNGKQPATEPVREPDSAGPRRGAHRFHARGATVWRR